MAIVSDAEPAGVTPARANSEPDARPRAPRLAPRALLSSAFPLGFALACAVTIACGVRLFAGDDDPSGSGRLLLTALFVNLALILALTAHVGAQVVSVARGQGKDEPAPRLHIRLVGFLSVAALVPAILVAAFLGAVYTRALDQWFSERVGSVVENAAAIADAYLKEEGFRTETELLAMASDLNQVDVATALTANRITYETYLSRQAALRGFDAAFVVDRAGSPLARAAIGADTPYAARPLSDFEQAAGGTLVWDLNRDTARLALLYRLNTYENAYLHVVRQLNPDIVQRLVPAEDALVRYREAADRRGRLQTVVGLLYVQTALLVLLGAAWLGLVAANRIVAPIGRLVRASERVRDGDLNARVVIADERDELASLGRAFNEMTGRLKSQHGELRAATDEAEAGRRFSEAVLSGVSAGVLGIDAAGRITVANSSAHALLGAQTADDLVGESVDEAAPELSEFVRDAQRTPDEPIDGQAEVTRDGRVRVLNVRAGVSRASAGAVVVTFDDITRLVSAQRNAAWRDVARRIAHEIKNPLTPIQLSAERLKRKYEAEITSDPEVFTRCTDTIVRQVADIGRMVDEFSHFSRMPEPKLERVEIVELARGAVFAQRVASPDFVVEARLPDTPVYVTCDERLIAQALANVLKNAAEAVAARVHADPGGKGAQGRIDVSLTVSGGDVAVAVADNGVGWPAANRERLVEPYMTTREKGTGLGLAIVRRVMEDHRGRLELADRDDGVHGAVVRLVLPLDETVSEPALVSAALKT